jgi:MFS family permease
MATERLWTKNFINTSICNFFVFMNYYFLLVTLPIYVIHDLKVSETMSGLISTIYLIAAIIIRPIVGPLIEKSRKLIMLKCSLLIFIISSFLYLLSDTIGWLLAIRFLHGMGFGIATTATSAIVADIIPSSKQGEGMGYFILSSNLAMVIGPFLGLVSLEHLGSNLMLIVALICSITSLLCGLFIHLESETSNYTYKDILKVNLSFKNLLELSVLRIAFIGAFFALAYSSVLSFVSVYAKALHLGDSSNLFFVVYAISLLISRPLTGKWFDRYGPNKIIVFCVISFSLGLLILSTSDTSFLYLISAIFIGIGWGNLFPSFQTITIQSSPLSRSASAIGTFLSIFDFGLSVGSFLTGIIVSVIGFQSLYLYNSLHVLLGLGLYFLLIQRRANIAKEEKKVNI